MDKVLLKKGLKIIFLLRLCPFVPFSFLNYALGPTSLKAVDFFLGNFGQIPEMILLIYLGSAIG